MPTFYTEDVAAAALERQGYVVIRNVWFRASGGPSKRTDGWTDIDILVVGRDDVLICSRTAFLDYGKPKDLRVWSDAAVEFVRGDARFAPLTQDTPSQR